MNRATEYAVELIGVLAEAGIDEYRVEQGKTHRKLVFRRNGRKTTYFMPSSPSDVRGLLNAKSDLRAMVGRRKKKRKVREKVRKVRVERPVSLPRLTPTPDWHEDLFNAVNKARWDEAKRRYDIAEKGQRLARKKALMNTAHQILREELGRAA